MYWETNHCKGLKKRARDVLQHFYKVKEWAGLATKKKCPKSFHNTVNACLPELLYMPGELNWNWISKY